MGHVGQKDPSQSIQDYIDVPVFQCLLYIYKCIEIEVSTGYNPMQINVSTAAVGRKYQEKDREMKFSSEKISRYLLVGNI